MFGNRYILARSDGFVKCYIRGWTSGDYSVSAPFDNDGITHTLPNGDISMFKYSVHSLVTCSFLPSEYTSHNWNSGI